MSNNVTGIQVELDEESYKELISTLDFFGANADRAQVIAINKTMPKIRTKGINSIYARRNLKKSYIREKFQTLKANKNNVQGRLRVSAKGLLLNRYESRKAAKQNSPLSGPLPKNPPRVRVNRGGELKKLSKKWFFIRFPNQYIGIARRRSAAEIGPDGGELEVAYAPSVSQEWFRERDEVAKDVGPIYEKNLRNAANFLLRKKYPR